MIFWQFRTSYYCRKKVSNFVNNFAGFMNIREFYLAQLQIYLKIFKIICIWVTIVKKSFLTLEHSAVKWWNEISQLKCRIAFWWISWNSREIEHSHKNFFVEEIEIKKKVSVKIFLFLKIFSEDQSQSKVMIILKISKEKNPPFRVSISYIKKIFSIILFVVWILLIKNITRLMRNGYNLWLCYRNSIVSPYKVNINPPPKAQNH